MDTEAARIIALARDALGGDAHPDLSREAIAMGYADGVMTLEGEASSLPAKKLALERIAALPEVTGIIDRLRVAPATRMEDGEIRDHVRGTLVQEPAFERISIVEVVKGRPATVRDAGGEAMGEIRIEVVDGVVTLSGDVPGLEHKRLAGVLAWWVPGSRDVVNGLGVTPPEEDSPDAVSDAVRTALEKDPFVDASRIRIHTSGMVVTLEGLVPSPEEREMAELDAWYVFGVDRVVNLIDVRA